MIFYYDEENKSYDVTHAGGIIKLFKDVIPEDDTESVVRVQLYRNFRVAKINRPGYERLIRDAAKRVDKNYPTLTGVKRQREILDACHDIIYDITQLFTIFFKRVIYQRIQLKNFFHSIEKRPPTRTVFSYLLFYIILKCLKAFIISSRFSAGQFGTL